MLLLQLLSTYAHELHSVCHKTAQQIYCDSGEHVSDWSDSQYNQSIDTNRSTIGH